MDFIIEASGVSEAVEKATNARKEQRHKVCSLGFTLYQCVPSQETLGSRGEPLFFTKKNVTELLPDIETRKIETFEAMDRSYNDHQVGKETRISEERSIPEN